jgi:hypothetical protein
MDRAAMTKMALRTARDIVMPMASALGQTSGQPPNATEFDRWRYWDEGWPMCVLVGHVLAKDHIDAIPTPPDDLPHTANNAISIISGDLIC